MPDIVQIVDAVASSPAVLLDLNSGTGTDGWFTRLFSAPAPRLRRAVSQNAMRDGGTVSSSQYDMRVVTLDLECIKSTQDAAATEFQALARLMDRDDVFLKYQPQGATKPVFFRLFRSDVSRIDDVLAQAAMRQITVELLAEPFALGIKETLGPFTVNNDPAAASNGHFVDVTGVIGDVPAPCVIRDATTHIPGGVVAMRQHGTPSSLGTWWATQAEAATPLTDTTNPGGGPDAAMSGAGTNNFLRTSFATTAAMAYRAEKIDVTIGNAMNGAYRLFVVARRSDSTSAINVQARVTARGLTVTGSTVAVPLSTSRQLLDLGVFDIGTDVYEGGYQTSTLRSFTTNIQLWAQRVSGAGTIDWDYYLLIPADESMLMFRRLDTAVSISGDLVLDGPNEYITKRNNLVSTAINSDAFSASGGFPALVPNQTNRCFYVIADFSASAYAITKTDTASLTFEYYPRYLFVRPVAS